MSDWKPGDPVAQRVKLRMHLTINLTDNVTIKIRKGSLGWTDRLPWETKTVDVIFDELARYGFRYRIPIELLEVV